MALTVTPIGEPGPDGAPSRFEITGFPSDPLKIAFNTAPEGEPPNGITEEALEEVLVQRRSLRKRSQAA